MAAKVKLTTVQTRITERRYDSVQKKSNLITSVLAHRTDKLFIAHYRTIQTFESKAGDLNVQLEVANEQLVNRKQPFSNASATFNQFNALSVRMANEFGLRRGKEIEGFDALDPVALSKNLESLFEKGHQTGFAQAQAAARGHFIKTKNHLDDSRVLVQSLEAKLEETIHELDTRVYLARIDLIRGGIDIPKPPRKKKIEAAESSDNASPPGLVSPTTPSPEATASPA